MYDQLVEEFSNRPVVDYDGPKSWQGPGVAYRLREEYEDEMTIGERLDLLLAQDGAASLSHLIIGAWSGACEGGDSKEIVARLVAAAPRLPGLRDLFLGEMTSEESELSWINQSDVSPLMTAFPMLEYFGVRGGTELTFSPIRHESLTDLVIETGGLGRSTLRELFLCEFPALQRLELLLGEENYGFDGGVEDLQPLLSGRLFPNLTSLGLMNSEIANDLAATIVNSPIVERLDVLDLSMGNLDDEGVRSLHELASRTNLTRLDISHHYASEESIERLRAALPFELVAEHRQDADDEWRPILHAE